MERGVNALRKMASIAERWQAAGIASGNHLAVNVSQRQFSSPRFVHEVVEFARAIADRRTPEPSRFIT